MPKKIISKIAARAESVRNTLIEEIVPETLSKVKTAGSVAADGVNKARTSATTTLSSVKDNASTVVTAGIKQVSEVEWKKEFEKFKSLDLPLVSKLRPIDWTAEHVKFWEEDKAVSAKVDEAKDKLDNEDAPHALITVDADAELIPVEVPKKVVDEDELVYTSASEGFEKTPAIIITGKPGRGKGYSTRQDLLNEVSEVLNAELKKEEDKLSLDDSKEKETPAKKTPKVSVKDPVVTVLGSGEGEVEPLGTAYKRLVRKVAKQAEKNPDVKLYLSGKTFGIGARGTTEKIDGNDVSVFNAKDIKKLLAKIS